MVSIPPSLGTSSTYVSEWHVENRAWHGISMASPSEADLCIYLLFSLSLFSNYYFLVNYNLPLILHFLSDVPQGWNVTQLLTHPSSLSSGNLLQEALPWLKLSSSLFSHGSLANCSLLAYKFKSISLSPPLVTWPNFVLVFEYKMLGGGENITGELARK